MAKYKKMIKPFDIILVILLMAISFVPIVVFSMTQEKDVSEDAKIMAVISQDGEVIREITLTGHTENEQFTIKGKGKQYNIMEIENEKIRIQEDNSPDQIGVMMGWKGKPGETIICLPHKLLVEIVSEKEEESSEMILSH